MRERWFFVRWIVVRLTYAYLETQFFQLPLECFHLTCVDHQALIFPRFTAGLQGHYIRELYTYPASISESVFSPDPRGLLMLVELARFLYGFWAQK